MLNGSFDSQFTHLIKSTVNNFGVQSSANALAETDKICVYSRNAFYKTRAVHNSSSIGKIDRS